MHEVWNTERSLWLDGAEAYARHLADDCLMVFGPMGIMQRDEIIDAISQAPRWTSVDMTETALLTPADSAAVVIAYMAVASRNDDDEPYRALCTSTYLVIDGELELIQHQQTPL
jgi:hypothetical protein